MLRYEVMVGADDKPHMYLIPPIDANTTFLSFWEAQQDRAPMEKYFQAGVVFFPTELFNHWLQKPSVTTDTFEMFGLSWIVIERNWPLALLKCVPKTETNTYWLFMDYLEGKMSSCDGTL